MSDATASIARVASQIPGPVLLVGHACDGVVITNAALQAENVVGLAYVADLIPDEGKRPQGFTERATDSLIARLCGQPRVRSSG